MSTGAKQLAASAFPPLAPDAPEVPLVPPPNPLLRPPLLPLLPLLPPPLLPKSDPSVLEPQATARTTLHETATAIARRAEELMQEIVP